MTRITKQEAIQELWENGIVCEWLLDDNQKDVVTMIETNRASQICVSLSRQSGKSYGTLAYLVEKCMQTPNIIATFVAPYQSQAKKIAKTTMREILSSCPEHLRPEYKTQENHFLFSNGSVIELCGNNAGHIEKARGPKAHIIVCDEVGFWVDLKYSIKSVLLPKLNTTKGKLIMISTPPASAGHPFQEFFETAKFRGAAIVRTIYDCPRYTPEDIDKFAEECGGKDSIDFRREYNCVDEDTYIRTYTGYKKIKDIYVGELVLTHLGNWKPVLNVFKNPRNNRQMYKIKTSNNVGEIVTDGHKVFISKGFRKHVDKHELSFVEVQDIVIKDKNSSNERIYTRRPVGKNSYYETLTPSLAELCGWYAAEGGCHKTNQAVLFSFGHKDPIDYINSLVKKCFGKSLAIGKLRDGSIQCGLYSKKAKEFFNQFGRTADIKKVPEFILNATDEIKLAFLKGYWAGDGCVNHETRTASTASVSFELCLGISQLLMDLGMVGKLQRVHTGGPSVILGRNVNIRDSYSVKLNGSGYEKLFLDKHTDFKSTNFIKDGFFYSLIKTIEPVDYDKDFVYDIEVADDHSYVSTHNCYHNCEFVTDTSRAVIPEATNELMEEITQEWTRPPYFNTYVSMDIGFKDLTVILFAYHDFRSGKVIIEDEIVLDTPDKLRTDSFAYSIYDKEQELWGGEGSEHYEPYRRVSDINHILLNDLYLNHNLTIIPTAKDDLDGQINNTRLMVGGGKVIIHPRCKTLIFHLKNAIWKNEKRKEFSRSADAGHYDALSALIYLLRNVDYHKNPYPEKFDLNMEKESFLSPHWKPKADDIKKTLKEIFTLNKSKKKVRMR